MTIFWSEYIYIHTLCMRAANALTSLRICADSCWVFAALRCEKYRNLMHWPIYCKESICTDKKQMATSTSYRLCLWKTQISSVMRPNGSGPEVIKLLACSTQLSMTFILLMNVKLPTSVGIVTCISRINTAFESLQARTIWIVQNFIFYELKFRAQLDENSFITSGSLLTVRHIESQGPTESSGGQRKLIRLGEWMDRVIWVFAWRTSLYVSFVLVDRLHI